MHKDISNDLASFLKKSPTAFHAVESVKERLLREGFEELTEFQKWNVTIGGKYFITRNHSSIIALHLGSELEEYGFQVVASHTDLPTFKIKENAEIRVKEQYTQLNTEGYGGMICSTWLDRPLSVAGRLVIKDENGLSTKLIAIDRDLLMIPSLAIHMNREVNEGYAYNKQVDMLPMFGGKDTKEGDFKRLLAEEAGVEEQDILGSDLFLYNRMEPSIWGANQEFISSGHLDDLQCAYASLQGFLKGNPKNNIHVYACFDNEEVGSGTKQGAASTFLSDVLQRINRAIGKNEEDYLCAVANSFMISADNAHAVHPNQPQKADPTHQPFMNQGIVIKSHAGQKYTSDAVSIAVFKKICELAEVPVQLFTNRSDMAGGSTLGNIAMTQVSMNCVDIGLAQLAMHSSYETAGTRDTYYLIKATEMFFNTSIRNTDSYHMTVES